MLAGPGCGSVSSPCSDDAGCGDVSFDGGASGDAGSIADAAASGDGTPADAASGSDGQPADASVAACPTLPAGGQVREWTAVFGSAWPAGTSNISNIIVPDPGYLAVRFNTGAVVGSGRIVDVETTAVTGVRRGTISECQGDYRAEIPATCKHTWGIGGGIRWSTLASPAASECALNPNTTYYFNTTFLADVYDQNSSTCSPNYPPPYSQECVVTLNHTSY